MLHDFTIIGSVVSKIKFKSFNDDDKFQERTQSKEDFSSLFLAGSFVEPFFMTQSLTNKQWCTVVYEQFLFDAYLK